MSKCLKCGAPLPPVGDCPSCAAASQPAARAVPNFLDKEIQIDRRRPDRDAPAMPPGPAAAPPGMTARGAATPPGMTPVASRQQAPAPAAPRAPGLPVMPPRAQAPAAQMTAAPAPRPQAPAAPMPPAPAQAAAPRPPAPAQPAMARPPAPQAPAQTPMARAPMPPAPAQAAAPRPPPPAPPQPPAIHLPGVAAPAPRSNTPAFGVPNAVAPQQASAPGLPVMTPRPQATSGLSNVAPAKAAPAPLDLSVEEESFPVDVEESELPTIPATATISARVPPPAAPAAAAPVTPKVTGTASKETEIHARPASLWRRLLALSIDTGAIAGVAALYLMLASSVAGVQAPQTSLSGIDALVVQIRSLQSVLLPGAALLLVLSLVYCAVSAFLWNGRTLGRRLLGLRLVDMHGLAPAPGRAILRAMLASLSFGLFLAGFWMALFDRRGQTLHDKLTSTYVVQPS